MQDNLDINRILERSRRQWELVELCSPVKVWVVERRRKRLQGAVHLRGYTPPARNRQRLLLAILEREGAQIEKDQQVAAIREAYPGVSHLSAKHLLEMWGKR